MEKCNIVITESQLTQIESMKNKLLLWDNQIVFVSNFEFKRAKREVIKGIFKKRTEEIEEIILTGMDIIAWHRKGKFWAVYSEIIINRLLNYNSLYDLREDYILGVKEPLENLGINMGFPTALNNSLLDLIKQKDKEK